MTMTKQEFINELRGRLYMLPPTEREAALEYYAEYFDDAGVENEQRVIAELGTPQQVAEQILSGCNERYMPPAYAPKVKAHKGYPGWLVLICILLSPILLPLAITAVVLLFTGAIVAVVLIVVFAIVTVVLIFSGLVLLFCWVVGLGGFVVPFVSYPPGAAGLGVALAALGFGLMLIWPCCWLFSRGIPHMAEAIRQLFKKRFK